MKSAGEAVDMLRSKNIRITTARASVIETIFGASSPLGAGEVLAKLAKKGVVVNKTTVYRELAFLLEKRIIKEVHLRPGATHYESAFLPHHHHLVCEGCGSVEAVDCVLDEKTVIQKAKTKGFALKSHKLELYGVCVNCG